MDYGQACDYLHQTLRFGVKLGLSRMNALLDLLGNPQDDLRVLHVAGTNGKGSVSAYAAFILAAAGHKTGLFTSPYIERLTERIRILNDSKGKFSAAAEGADEISREDFAKLMTTVRDAAQIMQRQGMEAPTEFETLTALAFCYFREQSCDLVVLETGLGGRMDSTNVIRKPLACLITAIGYDHMDRLGNRLQDIAYEKGGIIKDKTPLFLIDPRALPLPAEEAAAAFRVFFELCQKKEAPLNLIRPDQIKLLSYDWSGQRFADHTQQTIYTTRLLGVYQPLNALLAARTCLALNLADEKAVVRGLADMTWPVRMEVVGHHPPVILDGAHNLQSCQAFRQTLERLLAGRKVLLITGMLQDKDVRGMLQAVLDPAAAYQVTHLIVTTPDSPRAMPAEDLAAVARTLHKASGSGYNEQVIRVAKDPGDSVRLAQKLAQTENIPIGAFGSLYLMGALRSEWRQVLNQK